MDLDASKRLDRHEFAQTEELPSVGGEDGDLGGQVLLAQEVLAQLHHKVCLMLVLVTFAFLDFLFRKVVLHKEKVGGDPLNLLILENRRMVLQILVNVGGQKAGDLRTHAVLVIQTDEGDVHFYQPFKQGHFKVEVLGQIIHISAGAQLLVVPDQNKMLASFA